MQHSPFGGSRTVGWLTCGPLLYSLLIIAACHPAATKDDKPALFPDYQTLVRKHNRRLLRLGRLTATLSVVLTYHDDEGKKHVEQADGGRLAIILPDRIMMQVRHFGRSGPILWIGSNGNYYWVFDFREGRNLRFGRHEKFFETHRDRLDVSVHPRQLPHLLGIVPLEEDPTGAMPDIKWREGCYVVTLAEADGTRTRLWINPRDFRAVRVDVLDSHDKAILVARLSEQQPVHLANHPPDGRTRVATRIEITRPGHQDTLKLSLAAESLADGPIKDQWFDLEKLSELFKIPREQWDDLDE